MKVRADHPSFYDYTTSRIGSLVELEQLAAVPAAPAERASLAGAKFVITAFSDEQRRRIHYLDGRHYKFHDEWAWFRLLNGHSVPGMAPLEPRPFESPEAARRWAVAHEEELPPRLEVTDGRLYAREFYELTLAKSERVLGAGALIHVAARGGRPELWGFEIDYLDPADVSELSVFLSLLEDSVPEAVRGKLKWIARSPEQLETGKRWAARDPRLVGRVMTYADVSIPGETAVYTSGIVAGRLRAFRELSRLAEAEPEDILLLGALPEYLPQARGLVTAIPQTPLAHLNLLAKNRQIVNAYRGGVLEDPDVQDLVRSRAPVVLAAEQGQLRLQRISEAQYRAWQERLSFQPPPLAPVDAASAPYVLDLGKVQLSELPELGPFIGGKGVGLVHLLRGLGPGTALHRSGSLRFDVPDRPLIITIRAYREHLQPLRPELEALFADENFRKFKKLRFLALEGSRAFAERFPSKKDRELAQSYENPRALGPIAAVVRRGGVVYMVRHAKLPPAVKAELERALPAHFAGYSLEQGLRFRSSSTVEDIEGFNGAGLYDSSTGFLVPRKKTEKLEKRASLGDALRKTWASYFGVEAFEERHQNRIDHLAADMAVLVHARFDDELEQANGVFTFTLAPELSELAVDAQPGAVSVTNPPTDRVVIPESSRVRRRGAELEVQRQSLSSLNRPGQHVLTDAELRELFALAERQTKSYLQADNAGVAPAQQRRSIVLDFEFRRMAPGWPALERGSLPGRFVIKQVRPLEPSPRVSEQLRAAPIPRDVLARARRVETRRCVGDGVVLDALSVLTEPHALPDLGYTTRPLLAGLGVTAAPASPRVFTHLELSRAELDPDRLSAELRPGFAFARVEVVANLATLTRRDGSQQRVPVQCETLLEHAEPRELLRSFLAQTPPKR